MRRWSKASLFQKEIFFLNHRLIVTFCRYLQLLCFFILWSDLCYCMWTQLHSEIVSKDWFVCYLKTITKSSESEKRSLLLNSKIDHMCLEKKAEQINAMNIVQKKKKSAEWRTGLSGIRCENLVDNLLCIDVCNTQSKRPDCDLYTMPIISFWFTEQSINCRENINEANLSAYDIVYNNVQLLFLFLTPLRWMPTQLRMHNYFQSRTKSAIEWIGWLLLLLLLKTLCLHRTQFFF